jgi:hypothetical protein
MFMPPCAIPVAVGLAGAVSAVAEVVASAVTAAVLPALLDGEDTGVATCPPQAANAIITITTDNTFLNLFTFIHPNLTMSLLYPNPMSNTRIRYTMCRYVSEVSPITCLLLG